MAEIIYLKDVLLLNSLIKPKAVSKQSKNNPVSKKTEKSAKKVGWLKSSLISKKQKDL